MPAYGKLVRDRIPVIIAASGKKAIWRGMEDDE
ncbi:putative house-cleaning noncanonical NTP pyrophosphatase (MazG superfamily) [Kroppenstedtia sanguinis]